MSQPSFLQIAFNNLHDTQKHELYEICYNWYHDECKEKSKSVELTNTEKLVANKHKVKTIMSVKNRLNCSVIVAKYAVDRFLGVEE
jgi:hypothetical protein